MNSKKNITNLSIAKALIPWDGNKKYTPNQNTMGKKNAKIFKYLTEILN